MRLGVYGCGEAGRSFAGAAHHVEGVELIGVGGRTVERATPLAQDMRTAPMTLPMLLDAKPDCIAVATPPGVHPAHALECLRRGIHVMVEKPMALCVPDCDVLITEAARRNLKLMVTQTLRYRDIFRKARAMIVSGRCGTLTSLNMIVCMNYFGAKRAGWQVDIEQAGGGVGLNPFIHAVDTARFLAGSEVTNFRGKVGYHREGFDIDGDAACYLEFASGATAFVHVNGYGVSSDEVYDAYCAKGVVRTRPREKRVDLILGGRVAECYGFGENGMVKNGIYGFGGYVNHIIEMKAAIESGGPISSDGANGRENVRIAREIMEASGARLPGATLG